MKKLIMAFCIGVVFIITGCGKEEETVPGFVDKYAYINKERGWIQELVVSQMTQGENEGRREFFIDGLNLTYSELDGYYLPVVDEEGNEVGQGDVAVPSYIYNKEQKEETKKINAYLNDKQFGSDITVQDIQDLQLQFFTPEDVVTLVKQALVDPYAEKGFGDYNIKQNNLKKVDLMDGNSLQLGYCSLYGYIRIVNIEYIFADGTHLSDMIEANTADAEQIAANDYLNTLEKEIVEKQEVEIHDVVSIGKDKDAYESALTDLLKMEFSKR